MFTHITLILEWVRLCQCKIMHLFEYAFNNKQNICLNMNAQQRVIYHTKGKSCLIADLPTNSANSIGSSHKYFNKPNILNNLTPLLAQHHHNSATHHNSTFKGALSSIIPVKELNMTAKKKPNLFTIFEINLEKKTCQSKQISQEYAFHRRNKSEQIIDKYRHLLTAKATLKNNYITNVPSQKSSTNQLYFYNQSSISNSSQNTPAEKHSPTISYDQHKNTTLKAETAKKQS
jgi:hypothetical protein